MNKIIDADYKEIVTIDGHEFGLSNKGVNDGDLYLNGKNVMLYDGHRGHNIGTLYNGKIDVAINDFMKPDGTLSGKPPVISDTSIITGGFDYPCHGLTGPITENTYTIKCTMDRGCKTPITKDIFITVLDKDTMDFINQGHLNGMNLRDATMAIYKRVAVTVKPFITDTGSLMTFDVGGTRYKVQYDKDLKTDGLAIKIGPRPNSDTKKPVQHAKQINFLTVKSNPKTLREYQYDPSKVIGGAIYPQRPFNALRDIADRIYKTGDDFVVNGHISFSYEGCEYNIKSENNDIIISVTKNESVDTCRIKHEYICKTFMEIYGQSKESDFNIKQIIEKIKNDNPVQTYSFSL